MALARLVVFNKRTASEPAKLLLSQFINRPNWKEASNKELVDNLHPIEKVLMQQMDLRASTGKKKPTCSKYYNT